jgi:hydroxymethylbilane synthase
MLLRIGSRGSRLALTQAERAGARLRRAGVEIALVPITTAGDRDRSKPFGEIGSRGVFVKEIEEALLAGIVDVGVHSLKDMPAELPAGLALAAFPTREDPRDVLLTRTHGGWSALPARASVGTSSLRRRAMVLARRPDVRAEPIRGNVETRIEKLSAGTYDGIVLALAGLKRLGVTPPHVLPLDVDEFVPAVGQGVLAIEAREADREVLEVLSRLDDTRSRSEALAERAFLRRLGADCHTPVAGHARTDGHALTLTGVVTSLDGATMMRGSAAGSGSEAEGLGRAVADELLAKGARTLLDARGNG